MAEIHEVNFSELKDKLIEFETQFKEVLKFIFKEGSSEKCVLLTQQKRNHPSEYKIVKIGKIDNVILYDINNDHDEQNADLPHINALARKGGKADLYEYLRTGWELFGYPFVGTNGYIYQAVVYYKD